ncbi:MAG: ribosomal RNA small subunit methyltransferase A [Sedimentisphaerales bacterium]|nr:ribosomal RNA small subunit methyltransferase A [Sedimentisphaerales bacterium]
MQNKKQIKQLLASEGISLNRQLGQNFLIDGNLINKLTDSATLSKDDMVLEVGCGTGSLTQVLAQKAGKVIAVELDRALAKITRAQLAEYQNVLVINCDILKDKHTINPTVARPIKSFLRDHRGRFLLVANLPYKIATPVILNLTKGPLIADAMYVTVQKEVAERMVAKPNSKNYGPLSIFLSAAGEVRLIRRLKPSVFWPEPKVYSAMVSFIRSTKKANQIKDFTIFSEVVSLFMGHRRKMLKSCCKLAADAITGIDCWLEILRRANIDSNKRPAQLSPEDYILISNEFFALPVMKRQQ